MLGLPKVAPVILSTVQSVHSVVGVALVVETDKGEAPALSYQTIDISEFAIERVLGKTARPEPYVL